MLKTDSTRGNNAIARLYVEVNATACSATERLLALGVAPAAMAWAFRAVYLLVAMLYVLRVKIPKPSLKIAICFGAVGLVIYIITMIQWSGNSVTTAIENYITLTA